MIRHPSIGDRVKCAETGQMFTVAMNPDGCTFNYGFDGENRLYSLEGCTIRDKRALLDRSRPFSCYLSRTGEHVTNWPGAVLGTVMQETVSRNGWHGSRVTHVRVRDVHGAWWHGRGAGRGMIITLRPMRAPKEV